MTRLNDISAHAIRFNSDSRLIIMMLQFIIAVYFCYRKYDEHCEIWSLIVSVWTKVLRSGSSCNTNQDYGSNHANCYLKQYVIIKSIECENSLSIDSSNNITSSRKVHAAIKNSKEFVPVWDTILQINETLSYSPPVLGMDFLIYITKFISSIIVSLQLK